MANFASSAAAGYFIPEFMQTIGSTTLSRLRIPPRFFAENMDGEHHNGTVTLISDQLACPWDVTLEEQTLTDGWPECARALKLKVSDSVVFTYRGNYMFEITAFGADGEKLEHEYWGQDEGAIDEGNSSLSPRGTRSPQKVAVDDITSFHVSVTESNVARNEVYLPKKFVELNGLDAKHIGPVTLTNSQGNTWNAVVKVCCDMRLKIGSCWTMFCFENGIVAGDSCKFKLVENTDNIVIKLVGLNDDEEVEEISPAARVQSASSSGFRLPEGEGHSMYSSVPSRGQRGQAQRK